MGTITPKEKAALRSDLYAIIEKAVRNWGAISVEPVQGGIVVELSSGAFAKIAISVCSDEKVDKWRKEYEEVIQRKTEKAQLHALRELIKAKKAALSQESRTKE